jgi:dipeptidase D
MGEILGQLKPALIWEHFEEITKYPRPSKKEEKISAYVFSVGERNKLETFRDKFGNVIIRKPASLGFENRKTIVLQGHLDMVCEKNSDVTHDFDNERIYPYIDNGWVKAKGTTLGADNGIGVAAALAVLESKDLQHGPIECLFTLDEETGLTGAAGLNSKTLKADILLNLDSEEEGTVYIGCAGGATSVSKFSYTAEKASKIYDAFEVKISGLLGGHSGLEIHQGRGNAIKILTRLLLTYSKENKLRISKIEGGNKHNAIPREAFAVVLVPTADANKFKKFVKKYNEVAKTENSTVEPNLEVSLAKTALPKFMIDKETQKNLLLALYGVPHGVTKMSPDIPGLTETSTNLATITTDDKIVMVVTSQRSSVASEIIDIVEMVHSVFNLSGAKTEITDGYPGWKPNVNSEILAVAKKTYEQLFNKEPEVKAIHAGLECGIISEKYPQMDMISFGPTMFGVHSPDEKLEIASLPKFWDFLTNILTNVPQK